MGRVPEPKRAAKSRFNVSMSFPSEELAVLSDGCGGLSLHSRQTDEWHVLWKQQIDHIEVPFLIGSSGVQPEGRTVDCLLVSLTEEEKGDSSNVTRTQINWIGVQMTSDGDGYEVIKRCGFETTNWPEVLTFDANCSSVYILCDGSVTALQSEAGGMECQNEAKSVTEGEDASPLHQKIQFIRSDEDSFGIEKNSEAKRVKEDAESHTNGESVRKQYRWSQTDEDVIISFDLPSDVTKRDVVCHIEMSHVTFSLSDGTSLIRGELFGNIDVDGSCWTMDQGKAEVSLEKKERGRFWPSLLAYKGVRQTQANSKDMGDMQEWPVGGGNCGNKMMTDEEIQAIHHRLQQYTSDTPDGPSDEMKLSQGLSEMMEECDMPYDDSAAIYQYNKSGVMTHKASLGGHQWLFNVHIHANCPQAVCLRHDVDGLLWQLGGKSPMISGEKFQTDHVATFHALGYVQASKQQRKFTSCSFDASFAVITDCNRHVYIYQQPQGAIPHGPMGRLADQHVVTLPRDKSEILGMVAFPGLVYVLTSDMLYIATI